MGIYYQPVNPNLGAQQPLGPDNLLPALMVSLPPVTGAITVPYPVRSWWDLPPPLPPAARNLNPPIAGPTPSNPPFMGGAKVPGAVHIWWIPPAPQPPVGFSAVVQLFPKPSFVFNPNFLTWPLPRVQVTTGPARIQQTWPQPRKQVTTPQKGPPYMNRGNEFSSVDPTEMVNDTWNFAPWLATGVTITSIVGTTCSLLSGTDAEPATRLIGVPVITASPTTGFASQAVIQQVSTMQPGCCYDLSCTVNTSDSQVLTLYAYQRCNAQN